MKIGDLVKYDYSSPSKRGLKVVEKVGLIIATKSTSLALRHKVQWTPRNCGWYHESNLIIMNEVGRKPETTDS